jgi:hypothetical protein
MNSAKVPSGFMDEMAASASEAIALDFDLFDLLTPRSLHHVSPQAVRKGDRDSMHSSSVLERKLYVV